MKIILMNVIVINDKIIFLAVMNANQFVLMINFVRLYRYENAIYRLIRKTPEEVKCCEKIWRNTLKEELIMMKEK